MNNQMQQTMQKVPGLGDIPVLGYLFRSKASQRDQTELVVMITPEILPSNSPGVTPSLPQYPDTFLPPLSDLKNTRPAPAPAFTQPSRSQAMTPAVAPVIDNRTNVEKAQDRALAAMDRQNPQPAAAPAVAPQAAQSKAGASQAVAPQAAVSHVAAPQPTQLIAPVIEHQPAAAPSEAAQKPSAEAAELTKEQRELLRAAREQAARDAKAAEKVRQAEEKRAAKAKAEAEKLAREQAKRDAEAAKAQAKRDAEAAKREAEAARKQAKQNQAAAANTPSPTGANAELEAQRQAALDAYREAERAQEQRTADAAAAERLRAAEAEYQNELARRNQR
jgi:hypothetical protein